MVPEVTMFRPTLRPDRGTAARLIVVGIGDPDQDEAALAWVADDAVAGRDTVHVVHAYVPVRLDGCAWEPVRRARDSRRGTASRLTAVAVQRLTAAAPGLDVGGSTVAVAPIDGLVELSRVVDLLVLGDADVRTVARPRGLARTVQDSSHCPVVGVPESWTLADRGNGPVTLIVDDHGINDAAMVFAARAAVRAGAPLRVSRAWASLHEGEGPSPLWLAHQQEEMDVQLADWRRRFPTLGIAARIELGARWRGELSRTSRVIVAGRRAARWLHGTDEHLSCPIAIVPDRRS